MLKRKHVYARRPVRWLEEAADEPSVSVVTYEGLTVDLDVKR
jgi:hypothetical protein